MTHHLVTGQLTVQQVIDALQAIEDKTLPVVVEGCDCHGECSGAQLDTTYNYEARGRIPCVTLTRLA